METNKQIIDFFNRDIQSVTEAKDKEIFKLNQKIQHLKQSHKKEIETIKEQYSSVIVKLEQEIEELKSKLNTNSSNSSLPPSTDQYKEEKPANKYNSRQKTKRKKGGQKGHQGKTLTKQRARELVESGRATEKVVDLGDPEKPVVSERYILDIEVRKVVTRLVVHEGADTSEIPRTGCWYGDNVKALAVMLDAETDSSIDKVCSVLKELTGNDYPISPGFVNDTVKKFAELSQETVEGYLKELSGCGTLYTDATSMPVNGKRRNVRNISGGDIVVYVPLKTKTIKELLETPVLPLFKGNLVHDHETALYNLRLSSHFECGIHFVRRGKKSQEDTGNTWQNKMIELLVGANDKLEGDECVLEQEELDKFLKSYDEIVELGRKQNKKTKNEKFKKKENSLLNDLEKYKENYTGFASTPGVGFTNNRSERDLRKVVCRRKSLHGTRSFSGLETTCTILSVTETLKKQKKPLLKELKKIFRKSNGVSL